MLVLLNLNVWYSLESTLHIIFNNSNWDMYRIPYFCNASLINSVPLRLQGLIISSKWGCKQDIPTSILLWPDRRVSSRRSVLPASARTEAFGHHRLVVCFRRMKGHCRRAYWKHPLPKIHCSYCHRNARTVSSSSTTWRMHLLPLSLCTPGAAWGASQALAHSQSCHLRLMPCLSVGHNWIVREPSMQFILSVWE